MKNDKIDKITFDRDIYNLSKFVAWHYCILQQWRKHNYYDSRINTMQLNGVWQLAFNEIEYWFSEAMRPQIIELIELLKENSTIPGIKSDFDIDAMIQQLKRYGTPKTIKITLEIGRLKALEMYLDGIKPKSKENGTVTKSYQYYRDWVDYFDNNCNPTTLGITQSRINEIFELLTPDHKKKLSKLLPPKK